MSWHRSPALSPDSAPFPIAPQVCLRGSPELIRRLEGVWKPRKEYQGPVFLCTLNPFVPVPVASSHPWCFSGLQGVGDRGPAGDPLRVCVASPPHCACLWEPRRWRCGVGDRGNTYQFFIWGPCVWWRDQEESVDHRAFQVEDEVMGCVLLALKGSWRFSSL